MNRRDFLKTVITASSLFIAGKVESLSLSDLTLEKKVWQIDPDKCIQCGRCQINCVIKPSAVKCVQSYAVCGYCDLCTGYLRSESKELNTGAENQLCPTSAIKRTFVEDPYYQYSIDETLCIACGKCVKGCFDFGNGSLYLQIRHNRCVNCNECNIAKNCPAKAISRISAANPYLLKGNVKRNG